MSIFGSIVSAIFGTAKAAAEAVTGVAAPAKPKPMTREEVEAKIQKIAKEFRSRELQLEAVDRRPHETAQSRFEPWRPRTAR